MLFLYFLINCLTIGFIASLEIDILMPNVSPRKKDSYLCRSLKLDENEPSYITAFNPQSKKEVAHHMLLYACENVVEDEVWDCGEMHNSSDDENPYKSGPICNGGKQNILYAWAMDAPELFLPKNVAFKIGGQTDRKYLVLQVHYANVDKFIAGEKDRSGIKLIGQKEALPYLAAVFYVVTGGHIDSMHTEKFEAACQMQEDITIYPFAYRTHAHKLGIVNSGYVIKQNSRSNDQQWTEIGRRTPQLPQMFFPVSKEIEVNKGDIIAARCTMNNYRDHSVFIGATGNDEMCNFYIMYYVKSEKVLKDNVCFSEGPPFSYLKDFKTKSGVTINMSKAPTDMSEVPLNQLRELTDMAIIEDRDYLKSLFNNDKKQLDYYLEHLDQKLKLKKLLKIYHDKKSN